MSNDRHPQDPQGMNALLNLYMEALAVLNYSPVTIRHRRQYLDYFIAWCDQRGLNQPGEITKPTLERYQRFLYHYRQISGDPLTFRSQYNYLVGVRQWFKWLAQKNHILYNPASELELPKLEYRLPKFILTAGEADQIINQPDVSDPLGIRDRAILEALFSTAMRRKEIISVGVFDVDTERGTVMVRQGKNKKDRVVPIGDRALAWVKRYLHEVRPGLLIGDKGGDTLFLTNHGAPFGPNSMSQLVRGYVDKAQLGKRGACHLFRHSAATAMLENGADIRYIQAMLGHAKLETTTIYTQVSIKKLKEIHSATHPARLERKKGDEQLDV
jgi:integrase/recombinase XerD